jgi:hypothetical protein
MKWFYYSIMVMWLLICAILLCDAFIGIDGLERWTIRSYAYSGAVFGYLYGSKSLMYMELKKQLDEAKPTDDKGGKE